jgi:threonine aldolase
MKIKYIDLRSDSVTEPTTEMRKAMAEAEVGYDVFYDDPTVNKLEAIAAEMAGKEAALFMATGTMANQLAVMTWTKRGDEVILSADSHILLDEVGATAVLSSVCLRALPAKDGILHAADIHGAFRALDDIHYPRTGLVCMENALGRGTVLPLEMMKEVYRATKTYDLSVHTDGARIFNAMHVLNTSLKEIARYTDSLAIHLSKGLCAPIGSLLIGEKEFIAKARRNRHMIGGGWSHPGILAAAGIIALEKMIDRLKEDHENARYMAEQLSKFPCINVDNTRADINLVFFHMDLSEEKLKNMPSHMFDRKIKISNDKNGNFRFAFHHDISHDDVDTVIETMKEYIDL